ncbi:hypothetical protein JNK13_07605 [bacterium]|nr:hypothetical protein [bacterium]
MKRYLIACAVLFTGCIASKIAGLSDDLQDLEKRKRYASAIETCQRETQRVAVSAETYRRNPSSAEPQSAVYAECLGREYQKNPDLKDIQQQYASALIGHAMLLSGMKRCKQAVAQAQEGLQTYNDPDCVSPLCQAYLGSASYVFNACGEGKLAKKYQEYTYAQSRGAGQDQPGTLYGFHRGMELAQTYATQKEDEKAVALGLEILGTIKVENYFAAGRGLSPLILFSQSAARLGRKAELLRFLGFIDELSMTCPTLESLEEVRKGLNLTKSLASQKGITAAGLLIDKILLAYRQWTVNESSRWMEKHKDEIDFTQW